MTLHTTQTRPAGLYAPRGDHNARGVGMASWWSSAGRAPNSAAIFLIGRDNEARTAHPLGH